MKGPCKDCTERTVEPNCHNPDICEKWAEFEKVHNEEMKKRKQYAEVTDFTIRQSQRIKDYKHKKKRR